MDENKIADFDRALMKLAERHHITDSEVKTLFKYRIEGGPAFYVVSDTPDNEFIKDAIALFDEHFHRTS